MSSSTCSFLEMYEPLDVIGNGSFGIIRKVRRKSDGTVFARKELNFERMSERDRKQIVAEVNILKDLHHEHIVRYIDRHVDRDAGILYILMEYCGGGDLSTVIKQAAKHNRPIPEDTIWNYFMQILLALHHCHHPNGHARSSSGGAVGVVDVNSVEATFGGGRDRRVQILHRDLKPDNVFLDENNNVKLGDFGLSKALAQASFANTYVGTPYYMSPELMQEKAYDSKSDIWSLGCLIYELCALKPPFHEAKTHAELSICIRNGRIPPLPRGYSQALSNVIKSMLSLNPAMRQSAAQLLQHERLELVFKVSETEKMLATVKAHKTSVANKERELQTREAVLFEKEKQIASIIAKKDDEIDFLQRHVAQIQQQAEIRRYSQQDVETAIRTAVARREEELRAAVMQREEEVRAAMAKREEEILEAVRRREEEVSGAWDRREAEIARDVQLRIQQIEQRADAIRRKEEELNAEEMRLNNVKEQLEDRLAKWDEPSTARKEKTPLEEVKNLLTPLARERKISKERVSFDSMPTPKAATGTTLQVPSHLLPPIETPESRAMFGDFIPSAMKGVILTSTGQVVETPTPSELVNIFKTSPKVGLGFAKIFDFDGKKHKGLEISSSEGEDDDTPPPPSPSCRKERERERLKRGKSDVSCSSRSSSSSGTSNQGNPSTIKKAPPQSAQPATRLRKPSIRTSARTALTRTATAPAEVFNGCGVTNNKDTVKKASLKKSAQRVSLSSQKQKEKEDEKENNTVSFPPTRSAPKYDLEDEANLPSPFLKRGEREENPYRVAAGAAQYDEDNLPSPFLKKIERVAVVENAGGTAAGSSSASSSSSSASSSSSSSSGSLSLAAGSSAARVAAPTATGTGSGTTTAPGTGSGTWTAQPGTSTTTTTATIAKKKQPSSGIMLRAMAAANNAVVGRRGTTPTPISGPTPGSGPTSPTRSSASRAAQIHADSHTTKNGRRTSGGGKVLIRS